ncbi:hypothetical protein [Paenibacillus lutrae]|uniref:Uncharacterized protein n=1 Tax=Paenibacillus lutrae TaxID=2078573 RepID=A0A7X3FM08_9BACL|nr:hypothetical protein [Paenibacillus lutrae]MVP02115.1 hypothetical protein [Paenibacillus lutrae]
MELNLKDLLLILPSILLICGWGVTYFSNRKQKQNEIFLLKVNYEIKEILAPMYQEIQDIRNLISHRKSMNRALDKFQKKFSGAYSPLYTGSNSKIFICFQDFDQRYIQYKEDPCEDNHNYLWVSIDYLYSQVKSRLKEYRRISNSNHEWFLKINSFNPLIAVLADFFRLVYVTLNGLTLIALGVSLCSLIAVGLSYLGNDPIITPTILSSILLSSILVIFFWLFFFWLNKTLVGYQTGSNKEFGKLTSYTSKDIKYVREKGNIPEYHSQGND